MKRYILFVILSLLTLSSICADESSDTLNVPIQAGPGYYAILPNKVLLSSKLGKSLESASNTFKWTKVSGPGEVIIERPDSAITWATVTLPGKYVFKVKSSGKANSENCVNVNVYSPGSGFGNPLLPGMFPDPHVIFDSGRFYIYATSMENEKGAYGRSSVWISDDFVNWEMKLTNWPIYGKFGGDIWAPDIIRKGDKYYQFITRSGGYDTWIGVADHPEGPWKNLREDNTPIVSGGSNAGRIVPAYNMDSQPFIDDDGQAYMYWGWAESMAAKLTSDMKNIDGDVNFLKGTKWLSDSGTLPQWLTVDLGIPMPVTKVITCPEFGHVSYGYIIEVSDNNTNWKTLIDRRSNMANAGKGYIDTVKESGRYVRITMTDCDGNWAGLYDFSIFSGDDKVSLNKPVIASSTRGAGSEPHNAIDNSGGPNLDDFVEGSYMLKHNGTYYLLYSTGALHDGSYSVHYAMGNNPLGPFSKPNPNIVIRMNSEKTTKGPGHNSVLKFNDKYYIVYHQHNQPHEGAEGVFRQTCADLMEFNSDGTIKEVIPTQTGIGALQPFVTQGTNIALGKYATATSVKSGAYVPEYAFDQNNGSKWRAADNTYPQTLTVDLNGNFNISRIETSFEYTTLAYKYSIETSLDGKIWNTYVEKTSEFPVVESPHKDIKQVIAAFARITITGCQRPENGAGVYEFKMFGTPFTSIGVKKIKP